jgi:hypothetical protein
MSEQPRMPVIYDGREIRGFLLDRGKTGWEAIDTDERSLGTFPTQGDAADAISAAHRGAVMGRSA